MKIKFKKVDDAEYSALQADNKCIGGSCSLDAERAVRFVYGDLCEKRCSESMLRGSLVHKILLEDEDLNKYDISGKKTITKTDLEKKLLPEKELLNLRLFKNSFAKIPIKEMIENSLEKEVGYQFTIDKFSEFKFRAKCDFITKEGGVIFINDLKTRSSRNFNLDFLEKYKNQMKFYKFFMQAIYPDNEIKTRMIFLDFVKCFEFSYDILEFSSEDLCLSDEDFTNKINDFKKLIYNVKEGILPFPENGINITLEKLDKLLAEE